MWLRNFGNEEQKQREQCNSVKAKDECCEDLVSFLYLNKKFWEELIAYFP
jgi:hypothetical protein